MVFVGGAFVRLLRMSEILDQHTELTAERETFQLQCTEDDYLARLYCQVKAPLHRVKHLMKVFGPSFCSFASIDLFSHNPAPCSFQLHPFEARPSYSPHQTSNASVVSRTGQSQAARHHLEVSCMPLRLWGPNCIQSDGNFSDGRVLRRCLNVCQEKERLSILSSLAWIMGRKR